MPNQNDSQRSGHKFGYKSRLAVDGQNAGIELGDELRVHIPSEDRPASIAAVESRS